MNECVNIWFVKLCNVFLVPTQIRDPHIFMYLVFQCWAVGGWEGGVQISRQTDNIYRGATMCHQHCHFLLLHICYGSNPVLVNLQLQQYEICSIILCAHNFFVSKVVFYYNILMYFWKLEMFPFQMFVQSIFRSLIVAIITSLCLEIEYVLSIYPIIYPTMSMFHEMQS